MPWYNLSPRKDALGQCQYLQNASSSDSSPVFEKAHEESIELTNDKTSSLPGAAALGDIHSTTINHVSQYAIISLRVPHRSHIPHTSHRRRRHRLQRQQHLLQRLHLPRPRRLHPGTMRQRHERHSNVAQRSEHRLHTRLVRQRNRRRHLRLDVEYRQYDHGRGCQSLLPKIHESWLSCLWECADCLGDE